MICGIVICLLVFGSATECQRGPGTTALAELPEVKTYAGCREEFRAATHTKPLPGTVRVTRMEMIPPLKDIK